MGEREERDTIYLDHHATTPIDPRVLERMLPLFGPGVGNPSVRAHGPGRRAAHAVEAARVAVASLIGASPAGVVFTSGATEASYLALLGVASAWTGRRHVITSAIEHKAVLDAMRQLEALGHEVTVLRPDAQGLVSPDAVGAALRPDTALVSIMLVNNELGTVNPLAEIAARLAGTGALLHSDAAQAVGRLAVDVGALGVDLLALSAHKLYGPRGVGALYVSERARGSLRPLMPGGGQEGGLRGGTLNVAGIVGLGAACELARAELETEQARVGALRDRLLARLEAAIPGLRVNGSRSARVAGNLNITLPDVDGDALLAGVCESVAVTSGAACSAGRGDTSHVLAALGLSPEDARATLRLCVGRFTTSEEIERAADAIIAVAERLRGGRTQVAAAEDESRRETGAAGSYCVTPLGVVHNAISEPTYIEWATVRLRIEIVDPAQQAALAGLEDYSHVVVLTWLHLVETTKVRHTPQGLVGVVPQVGMFACRCPYRANPIAVTTARIISVDASGLVVEGLDAVTGTPVLDLKPYTPRMDTPSGEVRYPEWVDRLTL